QMAIRAELNCLPTEAHEAFDIKLVAGDTVRISIGFGNAFGLEHNNLATPGRAEIITQAVHEKMVAGDYLQLNDFLAGMNKLLVSHAGAVLQVVCAIVWWKPKCVALVSDPNGLLDVENQ